MIESPKTTAIVRTAPEESQDPDAPLLAGDEKAPLEQELLLVQNKPLTSKFRTILKHLRQRAGRMSRFRGFHIFLGYMIVFQLVSSTLTRVFSSSLPTQSWIHILVSVGLCRIALLWNHVVISEPSNKSWLRRIVDRKSGMKIIIPTIYFAAAQSLMGSAMVGIMRALGLQSLMSGPAAGFEMGYNVDPAQQNALFGRLGLALLFTFVLWIGVDIPTHVMITRVQASLLAEEEEPIVPFDRTFGGKVIPEVVGGKGRLGMFEAWSTFDWNSRVRLFKIYVKVGMMQFAMSFFFVFTIFAELRLILGKDFDQKVHAALQQARRY